QGVVLSSEQEELLFKSNMYENFGDIGMNIKRTVDDFQLVAQSNQNIQTVCKDMASLKLCSCKDVRFLVIMTIIFVNVLVLLRTWPDLLTTNRWTFIKVDGMIGVCFDNIVIMLYCDGDTLIGDKR
ncbi:unnamed protein product, partial [Brassica napus]